MRYPPGNFLWESLVRRWGFTPTPVPWADLYMALQTKLVDCQVGSNPFNTWDQFRDTTAAWYQFNTHFQHCYFQMNLDLWNSLSEEDQKIILDASIRQAEESFKQGEAFDKKYMDKMSADGIKVIVPADEELSVLFQVVRQDVWPVLEDKVGKDVLDKIRDYLAE